jgi:DNA repair protein RecN (Recombination protein N)
MLLALRISNFAVIDEAEVSFGPGLTVLTGETGAGKSILVDALGLLMGGRADPDAIRAGAEEAVVEAAFEATGALAERLATLGLPELGGEISVRRVVSRAGRGKAHVNGALVTVGVLGQLMRGAVDISGQHEHVSLFDPALHRELLDRHAGLAGALAAYQTAYRTLREVDARIDGLGGDERKAQERAELVRYQLDELERLRPVAGEDAALEQEQRRLANADKLRRAAQEAEALAAAQDGSAVDLVGRAMGSLGDAARIEPRLARVVEELRAAAGQIEDASRELSRYAASVEADPERLAEVEDRLGALRQACRKHSTDMAGLMARRAALAEELDVLDHRAERLGALTEERVRAEAEALRRAAALSQARAEHSRRFARAVQGTLRELALAAATFEVRLSEGPLGPYGRDGVELLWSANPGEPPRPLAKVASGGEASRVLLALKRVLARADGCGCYVLDEVDAGVSGAVAEVVGRMIKDVAAHHQVLCVTHLPQVAAFADAHWSLSKREEKGRTVARMESLEGPKERAQELARMLSGVEVTREAVIAAEALVRSAQRKFLKHRDEKKRRSGEIAALP